MLTGPTQRAESARGTASSRRRQLSPYALSGLLCLVVALVAFVAVKDPWGLDNVWPVSSPGPGDAVTVRLSMGGFRPTAPGTYTIYCDVCCGGQANPTMRGTLRAVA